MLLQPALVGARTTVLVCASPDDVDAEESLAALRFGERAGSITSAGGVVNTANMTEVLAGLDSQIEALETTVDALEKAGVARAAEAEMMNPKLRGLGYGHGTSRLQAGLHTDGSGGGKEAELVGGAKLRTAEDLKAGTGSR